MWYYHHMTNRDIIKEIRKPGDIEMPVLAGNDTVHILVKKQDLLRTFDGCDLDAECSWKFYPSGDDSVRRLDVA